MKEILEKDATVKEALTPTQQKEFENYVESSPRFNKYYYMFVVMLETALRIIVNEHNAMMGAKPLPHISARTLRHTGCTRMAEENINLKILRYIMGHSNIGVTMNVYNTIYQICAAVKKSKK